jgi:L-alanine-DL-glutamate epimerase-like enolase superfamily enzyme
MQITKVEITPVELKLRQPLHMANVVVDHVTSVFVRMETKQGHNAWGCAIAHPELTGEQPKDLIHALHVCADVVPDLHPTHLEYSLSELSKLVQEDSSALGAFDLAFHDLLGLAAGMPLYRILGGYRNQIQTSITIPITSVDESVEIARQHARNGFRMLKIKGGINADEDVRRVQAIHSVLPSLILRLDADGGYDVEQSIDVARALVGMIEMLEQPTPAGDIDALTQVTRQSPVPVLADQSVTGLESALRLAAGGAVNGFSIKVASCGGLRCARQMDSIARAAHMTTMVSCLLEPALLISAGLSFALSSPNVQYADLDGHLDLENDPTQSGFNLEDGWLIARDVPGLGCNVILQ